MELGLDRARESEPGTQASRLPKAQARPKAKRGMGNDDNASRASTSTPQVPSQCPRPPFVSPVVLHAIFRTSTVSRDTAAPLLPARVALLCACLSGIMTHLTMCLPSLVLFFLFVARAGAPSPRARKVTDCIRHHEHLLSGPWLSFLGQDARCTVHAVHVLSQKRPFSGALVCLF